VAVIGGAVLVMVGVLFARWLTRPLPPPRVLRTVQLTTSGRAYWGGTEQEFLPKIVTDGARIYFTETRGGASTVVYAPVVGGETVPIPTPSQAVHPVLADISPDGSKLLIQNQLGAETEFPLWILPTVGGPWRLVADALAHDAAWCLDGQKIVHARGQDLFVANADGSESRKLLTAPGRIFWPRWSPDGSRLRFTVRNPQTTAYSLWEASSDGANPHPLLSGWSNPSAECCGNWTLDGKYFVFQSWRDGLTNIWAIREQAGFFRRAGREPVQLTVGPLPFAGLVPSKDGKKLFVVGLHERHERLRYDAALRRLVPYLAKIPAWWASFSQDGDWVVCTSGPGESLWRSRADGSEQLQLTFPPMQAAYPRLSPDGKWIAFMGKMPGKPWKIYIVSPAGGSLQQLMPGDRNEADPNWSPDGTSLIFGSPPDYMAEASTPKAIHLVHLRTKQVSKIPGSDGLFSPRWSPDGRYVAAMPLDQRKLMLFDFTTQKWMELARRSAMNPEWTRDGKYVWFQALHEAWFPVYRVRVSDRKLEQLLTAKYAQGGEVSGLWFVGMALDDSPLMVLPHTSTDIYALEWEAP